MGGKIGGEGRYVGALGGLFSLTFETKNSIYTLRTAGAEELNFFTDKGNYSTEYAILYGVHWTSYKYSASASISGGIGYVNGAGDKVGKFSTIGLAIGAQAGFIVSKDFGIGLSTVVNLNSKQSLAVLLLSIEVAIIR